MKKLLLWTVVAAVTGIGFFSPAQAQAKEPTLNPTDKKVAVERNRRWGGPRYRRGGWGPRWGGYYGPRYYGPRYRYYNEPRVVVLPAPTYVVPYGGVTVCR